MNLGMQKKNLGHGVETPVEPAPLPDLLLLVAKLAAKRWYRVQAEQQAASSFLQTSKEQTCNADPAAADADASQQPHLQSSIQLKTKK